MADIESGTNPPNIHWQPPTTNTDGSAIVSPLNYNLYRASTEAGLVKDPANLFFVVVGTLQGDGTYLAPITGFPEGRHVVALTAVDDGGDESALSNSMGFTISDGIEPEAPLLLA